MKKPLDALDRAFLTSESRDVMMHVGVSNVPGPETPLYLRGWRLEASYPLSIPFHGYSLNITVQSYADARLRVHGLSR